MFLSKEYIKEMELNYKKLSKKTLKDLIEIGTPIQKRIAKEVLKQKRLNKNEQNT